MILDCKKSRCGETLIELVCVVGLIGILIGPMYSASMKLFDLVNKAMIHLEIQSEAIGLSNFISEEMKELNSIDDVVKIEDGRFTLNGTQNYYHYRHEGNCLYVIEGEENQYPDIIYSSSVSYFDFFRLNDSIVWKAKFEKEGMRYEAEKRFYFN